MSNRLMSHWTPGILVLVLCGCNAGNGRGGPEGDVQFSPSSNATTVSAYCERFAEAYSARQGLQRVPDSVRTGKTSDVMTWISNLFQPPDARFTSAYDCRFEAAGKQGQQRQVAVQLLLTETPEFAEYTQWDGLQTVPIEYVLDEVHGRAGFGVFKYLETR